MLKGIIPPLPTIFRKGQLDLEGLAENVKQLNSTNLFGYLVLGSNGETVYLDREEKLEVLKTVINNSSSGKFILAGTGMESIDETISLTNESANIGAKAALVLTPSYYNSGMNHNAFLEYFTTVANNSKIPILIYNVPKFTGINIEPRTVSELAGHPNIVGMKNSSENMGYLGEIISLVPKSFDVIVGTASVLAPGLLLGAKGGIVALANIAPDKCVELFEFVEKGKHEEAFQSQLKLISANKAVTSEYGIAGLKRAMDYLGFIGGDPRSPLQPFNPDEFQYLKQILTKAEIFKNNNRG